MTMPLHGTKTHPLTPHALGVLYDLSKWGLKPRSEVNPGCVDRLTRENLAEVTTLPQGKLQYLRITETGRKVIESTRVCEVCLQTTEQNRHHDHETQALSWVIENRGPNWHKRRA